MRRQKLGMAFLVWGICFTLLSSHAGIPAARAELAPELGMYTSNVRQVSDSIDVWLDLSNEDSEQEERLMKGLVEVIANLKAPEFQSLQTKLAQGYFFSPAHRERLEKLLLALEERLSQAPGKKMASAGTEILKDALIIAAVVASIHASVKYLPHAREAIAPAVKSGAEWVKSAQWIQGMARASEKEIVGRISAKKLAQGIWILGKLPFSLFAGPMRGLKHALKMTASHPEAAALIGTASITGLKVWLNPTKGSSLLVLNTARARVLMDIRDRCETVRLWAEAKTRPQSRDGDLFNFDPLRIESLQQAKDVLEKAEGELRVLERGRSLLLEKEIKEVRAALELAQKSIQDTGLKQSG